MDMAAFWNLIRELLLNSSLSNALSNIAAATSTGIEGSTALLYTKVYDWAKPQIENARLRSDFEQIIKTLEKMQGPDSAYAIAFCRAIHALPNTNEVRVQMMTIIAAQWKNDSSSLSRQRLWVK
jgi:hypothetical protein